MALVLMFKSAWLCFLLGFGGLSTRCTSVLVMIIDEAYNIVFYFFPITSPVSCAVHDLIAREQASGHFVGNAVAHVNQAMAYSPAPERNKHPGCRRPEPREEPAEDQETWEGVGPLFFARAENPILGTRGPHPKMCAFYGVRLL